MADTSNTSNTNAQSPQQTKELLEMIAAFKEKNKLEGDYRDLLKDSIKESQKAIKDQLKSAATIQNIGRDTINIEQAQKLINETKLKQYGIDVKIGNLQTSLGGKNSIGVQRALQYNEAISQRQELEDQLITSATEQASLLAKATSDQQIAIKAQSKADSDFIKKKEYQEELEKQLIKLQQSHQIVLATGTKAQKTQSNKLVSQAQLELTITQTKKEAAKEILVLANKELSEKYAEYSVSKNILFVAQQQLTDVEQQVNLMNQSLTPQEAAYAQALKTLELIKLQKLEQEALLALEKFKSKQIGLSGNLFKLFAEKLGIGKNAYAAMVEKATLISETNKKMIADGGKGIGMWRGQVMVIGAGLKSLGSNLVESFTDPAAQAVLLYKAASKTISTAASFANKMTGSGGPIAGLTSNVSSLISNIPLIGGIIAGAIDGFSNLLDFAVGATSKIQEMGREIGLTKVQAMALNNQFSNFAISTGKAYINSEKLFKTQIELTKQLGVNNQISKDNLVTYIELSKFLGVDAQTQAEIEKTSRLTGRSAKDIAVGVMGQVKGLQKATGISLNYQQVLKEVSSLSGYLGLQFAKYPEKLTKSLLTTKALGLELKTLDSMADSFLDFESSIGKEFEAQLLTGKEVNLSKARELFLNNDLAGAAGEISKQVGTSTSFMKENRIAAEAWAATFGMSRDQMADFLKQQEINAKFGATSTQDLQKKVALMRSQGREQEAINKLGSEEAFNKLVTASASEDLSGFIDKIKQSFADLVANTNLSDVIQNFIKFLASPDKIIGLVTKIKNVFGTIVGVMGSIFAGIMKAINLLSGFTGFTIPQSVITMTKTAGDQIKSLDVGNLLDYKKKDGVKEAEAAEAKKEEKAKAKIASNKVQTDQLTKEENKVASISKISAVKEIPYKKINDINQIEDDRMVSIDQYKQQMSISDIKSKKDLESYNYKQDFKDLKDAMAKNNSQPINVNVQNNATGPTAGAIGTAISIYGPSESSRNFAATG